MMRMKTVWMLGMLAGCAGDGGTDATDVSDTDTDTDTDTADVPTEAGALKTWLEAGNYLEWPAEAAAHDSAGPHFGDVRSFFNPTLDEALRASSTNHPTGSASVKELYGSGTDVLGWAVMVKTGSGMTGDDWYWYEIYDGTTYAESNGAGLCTGCHSAGTDYVRTPWP